jgi:hypothetical protein
MRIAAFLLALAALFGIAVAVGAALGPEPSEPERAGHAEEATEHASRGDAGIADARGLAVAARGLRLAVETPELERGREQTLRFRVLDAHDRPVRDVEIGHERRMHAIVVRRDLGGFQHVHPRMSRDGTWSVPLRLDDAGSYRLYADFTRDGAPHTLAADLRVDGEAELRALPAPASQALSDGGDAVRLDTGGPLHAGREATLRFAVTRAGRPVALAPYLGAGGHLVALREGDLAFLHVHPLGDAADGRVAFATTLPSAGRYRLFLQYRVGAQVRTVSFTLEASP